MMKWQFKKLFNLIFAILFFISALLQVNDTDYIVWIALYMYAAVLCFLAIKGKIFFLPSIIGIIVYSIYAIFLVITKNGVADWITIYNAESVTATMKAEKPWIENAREFFGLILMIFALGMNLFFYCKEKPVS